MTITAQNVIDRVRLITGDVGTSGLAPGYNWLDDDLLLWINDACSDLSRKGEYLEKDIQQNTISGTGDYVFAVGFFKVKEATVDGLSVDPIMRVDLDAMFPDRLVSPTTYTGQPRWVVVDSISHSITLFPTPDVTGKVISLIVSARPAIVTDGADELEVPDEWLETIVTQCLQNVKEWDDDFAGAGYFAAKRKEQIAENNYDLQVTQTQTYPSVRSLPGDDW